MTDGYPATLTPPWPHQRRMYALMDRLHGCALWCGMGTGKTKPVVDYIAAQPATYTALVVAPLTACHVWPGQVARHAAAPIAVVNLYEGSITARTRRLVALNALGPGAARTMLVANYDAIRNRPFTDALLHHGLDLLVGDEAHRTKTWNSQQGKAMQRLARATRKRVALSGTPTPNNRLDAFGSYRWFAPATFGDSWWKFRHHYAIYGNGPIGMHQIIGWQNLDDFNARFASVSMSVALADVLPDLPPFRDETIPVTLGHEAARVYDDLREQQIARIGDGVITPANVLVEGLRLQQITSGLAVAEGEDAAGAPTRVERVIDTAKRAVLTDLLDAAGPAPFVVFGRFTHDLRVAREAADTLGRIYGEISGARHDLGPGGTWPPGVQVLGVNIASGGAGIDLTAAHHAAFLSTGFNAADYDQARARLHRPGQTRGVTYYHLRATDTIDEHVAEVLTGKLGVADALLELLRRHA